MSFGLLGCVDELRMGNNSSRSGSSFCTFFYTTYLVVDLDAEPADFTYADEHSINRGTCVLRQPILKFHSIHGDNLTIARAGRCARRKESFCKSLCFSNR